MENPAGPVISETMVDSRVKSHQEYAESRVRMILDGVGGEVNGVVNQLIYEAYTKGLADGFAQRVFADGPKLEVE